MHCDWWHYSICQEKPMISKRKKWKMPVNQLLETSEAFFHGKNEWFVSHVRSHGIFGNVFGHLWIKWKRSLQKGASKDGEASRGMQSPREMPWGFRRWPLLSSIFLRNVTRGHISKLPLAWAAWKIGLPDQVRSSSIRPPLMPFS